MPSGAYGFPKRYRLNRPWQFERVLRLARYRKGCGPLRIFAFANTMPNARLGLVIGKRAVRLAHERNALKRVVREVFRTSRGRLPAVDIVVQLRGNADRTELRDWLEKEFGAMATTMKRRQRS